ncbi:DegT/DnrJ/EryC1/StrS family aminotransferase [Catenovulum sp. 2E275]|uniref:DegT/DnrJ/EryC1/StrS family aminotransferase n=1 Tax=Catenovulum sp. 2E275 TaxID=2980497 RepID=UPI0021D36063|nr:DegT/DnrJ/EryC1/StrS family aminotransferase [Catenovulum sp. 2E275]MCU4674736.1 DegT/DnrJ/EryC1/StrS family aminotransferase [Catenovulum sp. 2E275]
MNNFYPEQYAKTGQYPINHNYLPSQFADYENIWRKVKQVVIDGDFTLGQAVDKFEADFSALNHGRFGVGVGSGTDALFLSLKALGIGDGDEVITTPFTFFATIGAIVTAGAKPVFVDIGDDHNINAELIEAAITPRTKAIMPVHWAGIPCDMDKIQTIATQYNLVIVADACHAILSRYQGQGMAQVCDVACFSMHPLKNLNVWGDGGVIVTNNEQLAQKLYSMRNHGLINRDYCQEWAYNSRLDTIQAVVAQHLLDNKIEHISQKRIENAGLFDQLLSEIPQIVLPPRDSSKIGVYHLYMAIFEQRDALQIFLNQKGVDAKVHYPVPMHLQPAAKSLGHQVGDFPTAEFLANNCLSLPVHEFITRDEIYYMVECIQEFYSK